ncbi:MAG: BlaI/MecI/CopY family transcriptional regulator [Planctomycetaceae bacterium]|nr:BlaI/MecI/CopY family transcriptional regulator [Planctomycetaceae bacterium]
MVGSGANQPSELELQILGVLWDRGPSTVREIMEGLTDQKERTYTAVLSVIQAMQRKKLVTAKRVRNERAYLYAAKHPRETVVRPLLGGLIQRVFSGDPSLAVQQLLAAADLQPETIRKLRGVLDEAERSVQATEDNTAQTEGGDA